MMAVPAVTPVKRIVTPVTVDIVALLLLHTPLVVELLKVILDSTHTAVGPEITGKGCTVTVLVISHVVGKV